MQDSAQNLLQNNHYISHHILKALLHYRLKPSCFSYWQVLEQTYAPSSVCCCHAFSWCFRFSSVSSAAYQACISSSFSWKIMLITFKPQTFKSVIFFISALSSSLKGMLFSCFDSIKLNFYFICQIRRLLFRSNGSVSKMKMQLKLNY